ncbi:MAG: PIG-L family deacetylase [Actinomycetota bacterium]|nr:PIG-L family deacetylase [Actinomycetota bacterium]
MLGLTVRRALLVHAHPDDETLATGGTIARLLDDGCWVGVLTATRGERGDVVPGALPAGADLVPTRLAELASALGALGGVEHFFLGAPPARAQGAAPRSYADSGMRWSTAGLAVPVDEVTSDSLTAAPLDEVVGDMVAAITATAADLVISYDEPGGYGHPDHVLVHRAALAAARADGVPFAEVVPPALAGNLEGVLTVDVGRQRTRVTRALGAYRTQLEQVAPDHVVHVGGQRQDLPTVEYFRLR